MLTRCAIDYEPCARCLRLTGRVVKHTYQGDVDLDALRLPASPDFIGSDLLVYCSVFCVLQADVQLLRAVEPDEVNGVHLCAAAACRNLVGQQ